ncbi:response regulator of citrate/malate metabolism [Streptacidiphilus sp. MAP12-16]|uniref:response regulator n=1 Tax=Streptacidiphilus sp. MAP12-16 TaxID=3156300 RepID=UPI0035181628
MIAVLIVEDDPIAADAHRQYVERVPGFTVAGSARSAAEAVRFLDRHPVDLVLLDLTLPDAHGLQIVRRMRAAGHQADVIAVTAVRDLAMVRSAVSVGVVQYLLKPFAFAALRDKLERYARFQESVTGSGDARGQEEVDRALANLRAPSSPGLPKGMSEETLATVRDVLSAADSGVSASLVAAESGVSRVTARRYLEHLVERGEALREPRYGSVGRPELCYRMQNSRELRGQGRERPEPRR